MIQKFLHQYYQPSFNSGHSPKLMSVSYVPCSFNKQHPRILHEHPDAFELLLVTSGEGVYYLDSSYYEIRQGDLIFCNSGVLHDELTEKNKGLSFYGLRAAGFIYQNLPENHIITGEMRPVVASEDNYGAFLKLFEVLFQYADARLHLEEFCGQLMMSILNLAVATVYEAHMKSPDMTGETRPKGTKQLYRIKQYIDQNYHDDLSLESLGKIFYLSPYYLSHIFKEAFEIPPMQYIYRRRIGEAQSLLITTGDPVTKIAGLVGFGDSNYFSAQFKRYVGMTPSAYRKIYARGTTSHVDQ